MAKKRNERQFYLNNVDILETVYRVFTNKVFDVNDIFMF